MLRKQPLTASRNRQGFTMIEMFVVVLIVVILMAVALPIYLSVLSDGQKKSCRTNMQTIANAVYAAHLKSGTSDYAGLITGGVTMTNLPELADVPTCPSGGVYSLANGSSGSSTTFLVKCNYGTGSAAHGTYEPGVNKE